MRDIILAVAAGTDSVTNLCHDIKLAAIACEKLHFIKKLLIAFHLAQLEAAAVFRAVTQGYSA